MLLAGGNQRESILKNSVEQSIIAVPAEYILRCENGLENCVNDVTDTVAEAGYSE